MRSTKTTWAGTAAGVALVTSAFIGDVELGKAVVQVLAGLALIAFGLFARDDNVSSEGRLAPKNLNQPPDL